MSVKRSTGGRSIISLAMSKDKHISRTTQGQEGHSTRVQGTTSTDPIKSTAQLNSSRSTKKTTGQLSIGIALMLRPTTVYGKQWATTWCLR